MLQSPSSPFEDLISQSINQNDHSQLQYKYIPEYDEYVEMVEMSLTQCDIAENMHTQLFKLGINEEGAIISVSNYTDGLFEVQEPDFQGFVDKFGNKFVKWDLDTPLFN